MMMKRAGVPYLRLPVSGVGEYAIRCPACPSTVDQLAIDSVSIDAAAEP